MKNIYLLFISVLLFCVSCKRDKFFDQVPKDRLSLEQAFTTKNAITNYLTSVYSYVPDDYDQRYAGYDLGATNTTAPWIPGSSEAKQVWGFSYSNKMVTNTMTPTDYLVNTMWQHLYNGIQYANVFMVNAEKAKGKNLDIADSRLNQFINEARALRAYFYFMLLKIYGPVPNIGDQVSNTSSPALLPRQPVDSLVDYIVSELDAVINSHTLPAKAGNDDAGRIDQSIARVFKLQTLLYAASPLFNGSVSYYSTLSNKDGKKLFPSNLSAAQKAARWKKAADVAEKFISEYVPNMWDLKRLKTTDGKYDAYLSYREAVRGDGFDSETIFYRISCNVFGLQYERTPYHNGAPGGYRASGGVGPSQDMVDAYAMANGMYPVKSYRDNSALTPVFNEASGYADEGFSTSDYKDPVTGRVLAPKGTMLAWVGREPRFYADITFNNQIWLNKSEGEFRSNFEFEGNSGKANGRNDYAPTGYVVRKSAPLGDKYTGGRSAVMFRLAQLFLDYAEALNECEPGNSNILKYLNEIRDRAGVPKYGSADLPVPADQNAMRDAIRRERKVELSFENIRYFDVRRWGIAQETENQPLVGMNLDGKGAAFYKRSVIEYRTFHPRQYFWPIPQHEIEVDASFEKNLVQNPGW